MVRDKNLPAIRLAMIKGRISNLSSLMKISPGYDISVTASGLGFRGRNTNPEKEQPFSKY
jgi:hypothetical protein